MSLSSLTTLMRFCSSRQVSTKERNLSALSLPMMKFRRTWALNLRWTVLRGQGFQRTTWAVSASGLRKSSRKTLAKWPSQSVSVKPLPSSVATCRARCESWCKWWSLMGKSTTQLRWTRSPKIRLLRSMRLTLSLSTWTSLESRTDLQQRSLQDNSLTTYWCPLASPSICKPAQIDNSSSFQATWRWVSIWQMVEPQEPLKLLKLR